MPEQSVFAYPQEAVGSGQQLKFASWISLVLSSRMEGKWQGRLCLEQQANHSSALFGCGMATTQYTKKFTPLVLSAFVTPVLIKHEERGMNELEEHNTARRLFPSLQLPDLEADNLVMEYSASLIQSYSHLILRCTTQLWIRRPH